MSKKPRGGSRHPDLIPRSMVPKIPIAANHRLVVMTNEIDWTELLELVELYRQSILKNAAGRPPQLRALVGAMILKATRDATWRELEDLICYYAPAQSALWGARRGRAGRPRAGRGSMGGRGGPPSPPPGGGGGPLLALLYRPPGRGGPHVSPRGPPSLRRG